MSDTYEVEVRGTVRVEASSPEDALRQTQPVAVQTYGDQRLWHANLRGVSAKKLTELR